MTDFHPDSDLRGFVGDVDRPKPVVELGPAGPWGATAAVTPLKLAGGQRFEVHVAWGVPADGETEDRYSDTIFEPELELARATALAAIDQLKAARTPVLLDVRESLKRR